MQGHQKITIKVIENQIILIHQNRQSFQNLQDSHQENNQHTKKENDAKDKMSERQKAQNQSQIAMENKTQIKAQNASEVYSELEKRNKMPASLKIGLRKRAKQSGRFREKTHQVQNKTKLGALLSSKLKKEQIACGICLGVTQQKNIVNLCKCQHVYCKNCIQDYVTYKIKMYEEVLCPEEDCNDLIDQETEFYKSLTNQFKKNYQKIHQFYVTANDPTLKLCPKQDCEGIIKIIQGQPRICGKCKQQFCPKCYFDKHQGNCDQNQIQFLENNLHFRQCKNCKFVVQKTTGCNHMICRCKYQFCYQCGKLWTGFNHVCHSKLYRIGIFQQGSFCSCCNCCQQAFGQTCDRVFKFPLRLMLCILLFLVVLIVFFNSIFMIVMYFIAAFFTGMFGFSIQFISQLCNDKPALGLFFIIFFPLAMLVGLFKAFKEMFYQLAAQQLVQLWDIIAQGCQSIWH